MSDSPSKLARALYAALEAGQRGEPMRALFTEDATTLEHPNLIKPAGSKVDLARMYAEAESGAQLLSKQTYDVHSLLEHGELAIVRLTWTGVIARELGKFRAGQVLTAQIAQFITCRGGRIASIETFDCYEPFG